jgi:pyridoxal phosphate enzyme (YggS family)
MSITDNVNKVMQEISKTCATVKRPPEEVTIIGVTKYVDNVIAEKLLANGISNLGENRPEVFLEKYHEIGTKPVWHFIGTLQTRKVRDVINKVDYLHSLDRLSLAQEVNKRADKKVKCFVQVNVAEEESKHGLAKDDVLEFIKHISVYDKIEVVGLMTMAPDTDDELVIRSCFSELRGLQKQVQNLSLMHAPCTELSMGMTNDYKIAIEEGATFVRLGRCLVE